MKILAFMFLLFGVLKADKCDTPMEIAVIVDASNNLLPSEFSDVQKFIKKVGNKFAVSAHASHASVILAGESVTVPITFSTTGNDKKKFRRSVDELKVLGTGSWSLDKALAVAKKDVFSRESKSGVRNFLPHVAVVIASGEQRPGSEVALSTAVKELRDAKVSIYAIGVRGRTSFGQLRSMVKKDSQVFLADSFSALFDMSTNVSKTICEAHNGSLGICTIPVDIGFIVDSSGSITDVGYSNIKNFMKGISVYMGFKAGQTHVGIVLYSLIAETWLRLGTEPHMRSLFERISKLPHRKDVTRIDLGLKMANEELFSTKAGMRENVKKIAILLTDGMQTVKDMKNLIPLSEAGGALLRRNITIFAIGIGQTVSRRELLEIVRDEDRIITAKSFEELENEVIKIAEATCKEAVGVHIEFTKIAYDVVESERKALVEVHVVSGEVTTPITITFEPSSTGSAGDDDFLGAKGSVTFQPGDSGPKSIFIDVIDDLVVEPTESFNVSLTSSVPVDLGAPAVINIIDDDAVINFTRRVYRFSESENAVVAVQVTSGRIVKPVTVVVTPNPLTAETNDFVRVSKRVVFQPGETGPKSVQFDLVDDRRDEPVEVFSVSLSSVPAVILGEPSSVNIIDNDEPLICGSEKDDCHEFANCTDTGPLVYECTCKEGYTGDGKFCTVTDAQRTSQRDAVISFSKRVYDVMENETAVVSIEVSSGTVNAPMTVGVTTSPSTAKSNDFEGVTKNITFLPGETGPISVEIELVDDRLVEPTEAFIVSLSYSSAARLGKPASVSILDNDDLMHSMAKDRQSSWTPDQREPYSWVKHAGMPFICAYHGTTSRHGNEATGAKPVNAVINFTQPVYTVDESEKATVGVEVTAGQIFKPVTVVITPKTSTAKNDDFISKPISVTFQPEETGPKSVKFDVVDDRLVESTESFIVSLSSSSPVTLGKSALVSIVDNDAVINFTKRVYAAPESEKAEVGVVVTSGKIVRPVIVEVTPTISTAGKDDLVLKPINVTFLPGETGPKLIRIELIDDLIDEPVERFTVSLSSASAVTLGRAASVDILDNDEPPICGTEKDDCHKFAMCTDTAPGSYKCTCLEGYTGDGKTCAGPVIEFERRVYDVKEDEEPSIQISVTSGKVTIPVTIDLTFTPLSADEDDFTPVTKSVEFQPGETGPKAILVDIIDDLSIEPTEKFTIGLNASSPAVKVGPKASVNIIDNDAVIKFTKRVYTSSESEQALVGVVVTSGKIVKPVTVVVTPAISTAGKDDLVLKPINVTFLPEETGPKLIRIELIDDLIDEPVERFTVSLSSASAVTLGKPASVDILDNDGCAVDVGFLVDSTGSMRNCNLDKEKSFLKEIAGYFRIARGASRASVIVYDDEAVLMRTFNDNTTETLEGFKADVDKLPFQGGRVRLDKALLLAASTMFTRKNGMRPPAIPKVLIILNDGTNTVLTESAKEIAMKLRESQVRVIVVGVGEADKKQLGQIVATPQDLIMASRFEDAKEHLAQLSKELCPPHNSDDCKVVKKAMDIRIAGCMSQKAIEVGVCDGSCSTTSRLLKHGNIYEPGCRCCKPKTKVTKKVFLKCTMSTTQEFSISEAASCACDSCKYGQDTSIINIK